MGFWAHVLCLSPLLGLGVAWAKSPHLLAEPMFSFFVSVGFLAIEPTISLYHVCYSFTSPFISCYSVGLQADAPTVPAHFFINLLLRASLAHFSHLYLFWALLANIPVVPAHFTTSFLELPRPVYFLFTSFTPMGFLLNSLGFFGPITISLILITFWAYWPLSRPIEFTNSFPGLPRPIYFFFTSFYSHGLTTSLFGLPQPIYLFFPSFLFLWAYWPSILPFQPTELVSLFLYHFSFLTFSIVGLLLLLSPLLKKKGHQHLPT